MTIPPESLAAPLTPSAHPQLRACWGSALAGTVIALGSMFALSELCAGIGLQLIRPVAQHESASAVGMLAGSGVIIWIICGIISLFLGAWVAGHLARRTSMTDSTLHGVLVWALFTVLVAVAATTAAGGMIAGSLSLAGSALHGAGAAIGGVAQGAGSAANGAVFGGTANPSFSWTGIQDEARDLLGDPNPVAPLARNGAGDSSGSAASATINPGVNAAGIAAMTPSQGGSTGNSTSDAVFVPLGTRSANDLVQRLFGSADATPSDADLSRLEDVLISRGHLTREQAHQQVANWMQEAANAKQAFEDAKAHATATADAAAKLASLAAFAAFAATLLGLSAAAFGGYVGGGTAGTHAEIARSQEMRHHHIPLGTPFPT